MKNCFFKRSGRRFLFLAGIGMFAWAGVWAQDRPESAAPLGEDLRPAPEEPSVNTAEAALLEQVEEMYASAPSSALETMRAAIDEDSSAALPFALAGFLAEQGKNDEAKRAFREALRRMPRFARARRNLALLHIQDGEYQAAAAQLQILLADPASDVGSLWKMLGYTRLRSGAPRAAAAAYRTALALRPADPDLRRGLIQARVALQDVGAARGLILEELERDPAQRDLWTLLAAEDLAAGESFAALVRLDSLRRLGEATASTLMTEGNLLLERGLAAEAGRRFLEAANGEEKIPAGELLSAAQGLLALGENGSAARLLRSLGAVGPADLSDEEREQLALLQVALAEQAEGAAAALKLCRKSLREFPMNGPLLMRCGRLLQQQGALEKALVMYERAGRLQNESTRRRSLLRRAQIAVERGKYRRAEELLTEALEIEHADYIQDYLNQIRRMID